MRVESGHGSHVQRMMTRGRPAARQPQTPSGEKVGEASTAPRHEVKERGVIRRLREGHFNPIAALRHHMKFQAEITAAGIEPLDIGSLETSGRRGAALARFIEQYQRIQDAKRVEEMPPASDASSDSASDAETEESVPVDLLA